MRANCANVFRIRIDCSFRLPPPGRHPPLCRPLLTMRSACALVLALAAATVTLCSAEQDGQRPRHDSNLEICILPPLRKKDLWLLVVNRSLMGQTGFTDE